MMSAEDLDLLKSSVDRVIAVELITGEQFFAEVVIVVDEPPTPDVLLLRVDREPDGAFVAKSASGESILLSEISRVAEIPGVCHPTSDQAKEQERDQERDPDAKADPLTD